MLLLRTRCQTPHEVEVRNEQNLDLGPYQLILSGMVSGHGRSMRVIVVPTWVSHLWCLKALRKRRTLGNPMYDYSLG